MYSQLPSNCVIWKLLPATFNDPVRVAPALAATEYVTEPLPVPLLPLVTVIQESLLVTVQVQPDVVLILKLPVPPAALKVFPVGTTLLSV